MRIIDREMERMVEERERKRQGVETKSGTEREKRMSERDWMREAEIMGEGEILRPCGYRTRQFSVDSGLNILHVFNLKKFFVASLIKCLSSSTSIFQDGWQYHLLYE